MAAAAAAAAAMITAANSAAGQGLEVVGPANRFGAAVRSHRSPTTPISVPAAAAAATAAAADGWTDGRTNERTYRPLSPFPSVFYSFTSTQPTNERADHASVRVRAQGEHRVVDCRGDLGEPPAALVAA